MEGTTQKAFESELEQARKIFGYIRVPLILDICYLKLHNEIATLEAQFFEDVPLEWVGDPISIDAVTTLISNQGGDFASSNCGICLYDSPPVNVVTKPCKHGYHKECLESWFHACAANSHRCPYCRTELCPQPEYQRKRLDATVDYEGRLRELKTMRNHVQAHYRSLLWLKEEMSHVLRLET
jgi:hypothetical protein